MNSYFSWKEFVVTTLLTSIWINISEVFRYFVFVMPEMRSFLSEISNVAPMNLTVFSIWGAWDTLLTGLTVFIFWLYAQKFGNRFRSIIISGTLSWALLFVLFWVAMVNMGLAKGALLLITLPLSWIELVVASFIASKLYSRYAAI